MEKYINQLLDDLKAAQSNERPNIDYALLYPDHPANDFPGLEYIIEWEKGESYSMEELFGIKAEAFPPVEKLTETQIKSLVEAMTELWLSFNIQPEEQSHAPFSLIYQIFVNFWKTETVQYTNTGTLHIEFCHYDVENCPWGSEYCECKEYEQDFESMDEFEARTKDDNQNFDEDFDELPF